MNRRFLRAAMLSAAAVPAVATAAYAGAQEDQSREERLKKLEQEVQDLSSQIDDLKRSGSAQYQDIKDEKAAEPKVKIDNGRPTISSADGKFSASVRGLAQLDWGTYMQSHASASLPAAYGPDLSSGANFRRVYLGVQGKLFGDWSYNLNFDFGGSGGTEVPGHIQSVYLQYDGLAPFAFRAGAYPAPSNLEDSTASGDTIFLERNAPSDLQRNLAGGDGRDAVSALYLGDRLFGALSYTGNKVQEAGSIFGEQEAIVGRGSFLVVSEPDIHWQVGANGSHVFRPQGALARNVAFPGAVGANANGTAEKTFSLSDPPELTIDENGLKLVNTTALSANHVSQWGLETAGNLHNLYGQAGYYDFDIERAPQAFDVFTASGTSSEKLIQPRNDNFHGWYVQAAWTISGEERTYNTTTGAFQPPKPDHPLDLESGDLGAFELAARYSNLDLNDHTRDSTNVITNWTTAPDSSQPKTYTYYNTVRGGDQRIWTAALNWYPVSAIKLELQYQLIGISRLQSGTTPSSLIVVGPTTGTPSLPAKSASQNLQTFAIRAQVQF